MKFVIAANRRFKKEVKTCLESLAKLNADVTVYDLGSLGQGKPWLVKDNTFQTLGYYRTVFNRHPSRSIHKPAIVLDFLKEQPDGTVITYLDADTVVTQLMPEIEAEDFDVGLTVCPEEHRKILGWLNAGVIFFKAGQPAQKFLTRWMEQTVVLGNDQEALKATAITPEGIKLKEFPSPVYNYRHVTDEAPPPTAKVIHNMASITDPAMVRLWQLYRGGK